jgi:hypothetical protein
MSSSATIGFLRQGRSSCVAVARRGVRVRNGEGVRRQFGGSAAA